MGGEYYEPANNILAVAFLIGFIIMIIILVGGFIKEKASSKEGYEKGYCHYYGSPYDLYTGGYGDRWGYFGSNPLGKPVKPQVGTPQCGSYRCPYTGCGRCYGCGDMAGSCFRESRICGMNKPCMIAGKCGIERANY